MEQEKLKELLSSLTRDEKLLVVGSFLVDEEENVYSGHNTQRLESIDLVLLGRKGLLDHTDEELDGELESYEEAVVYVLEGLESPTKEDLLLKVRRMSRIDRVDGSRRSYDIVDAATQRQWIDEDERREGS